MSKGLTIAVADIENTPDLSWHYGNWDVNIDPVYTEVHGQITSIAWNDLNTNKVYVDSWDAPTGKYGFLKPNKDKNLLKRVVPKLRDYDILIGQNFKDFDHKKLSWRLNVLQL